MITKESFRNSPNYKTMFNNGDFAQPGVFGEDTAIRFNDYPNKTKYLEFETNDDWVLSTFTISAWVYITAFDYTSLLNLKSTYSKVSLSLGGVGTPYMQGSDINIYNRSEKAYNPNEWAHIVFVRDAAKNHYMFINGELSNTPSNFAYSDMYETWNNKTIMIGADNIGANTRIYGLIDDLVVTKDVLYTSDFTVPDKPMSEMYPDTNFLLNLYQAGFGPSNDVTLKLY